MKLLADLPEGLGFRHPASLLATWFGTGLLPVAPGTWGSAAALPFAAVITTLFGAVGLLAAAAAVFLAGWWAAGVFAAAEGHKDPKAVVVDEVVGQWLVLLVVPLDLEYYLGALVVFRAFDILKPWPAGRIDRRLEGGLGVMLDDVVAGVYGCLVMLAARALLTVI